MTRESSYGALGVVLRLNWCGGAVGSYCLLWSSLPYLWNDPSRRELRFRRGVDVFEEAEEVAVGGEDGGGVLIESFLVDLEGFDELVEVGGGGAGIVGEGVDGGGLGVGLAFDFLLLAVGFGLDGEQIALLAADDFRGLAGPF